jgi:hypothetical protein
MRSEGQARRTRPFDKSRGPDVGLSFNRLALPGDRRAARAVRLPPITQNA